MNTKHLEQYIENGKLQSIIITNEDGLMAIQARPEEKPEEEDDEDYLALLAELHSLLIQYLRKMMQYDEDTTAMRAVFYFSIGDIALNGSSVKMQIAIQIPHQKLPDSFENLYAEDCFFTDIIEVANDNEVI